MKTLDSNRYALLAVAALLTHTAFAGKPPPQPSSGTLVVSYPNAADWGLAAAPSGKICSVGNSFATGSQLVLGTSDSGNSWSVLDNFAPPGRYVDFFGWADLGGGIASDAAGNLYVSGRSYDNDGIQPDHWYVRRSADGGATWTTVDDFVMAPVLAPESRQVLNAAVSIFISTARFFRSSTVSFS